MALEFLLTQRNKNLLIADGFIYTLHSIRDGVEGWRCRTRTCKGAIYLNLCNVITKQTPHNHLSDPNDVNVTRLKCQI